MLSFGNATGSLFNRLGKLGLVLSQLRTYQNSQNTNMTNTTTGVVAQLNAESDIQALMGSAYIGILNAAGGNVGSTMQNLARAIVNRMIFLDNARIGQTRTSDNTLESIREVIRQMKIAGATVLAHTVTATPTSFTGTGNGVIVTSIRRPKDGVVLEHALAEMVLLTVTSDSYSGSTSAGNEGITVTGTGSQPDVFAFDWPLGSNASTTLSVINGNSDNTNGNILDNSGFETFTGNIPDQWVLVVGTAVTHTNDENSLVYDPTSGGSALRLTGDGSTLVQLRQQFNSSAGTSGTLDPLTQYSCNLFLRRDGTAAAAGVLTIDLVDGNFNVIRDENGASNSFTVDLTALGTGYTASNGVFRTPASMPSTYYIRVRMTTALTNGRSVYLDKMSLGQMTQLYTGGPYLAVHAGSIPLENDDYATVAITNSRGAGGTIATFQSLMFRLYPEVQSNELLLPSSSTPSIDDALIG